MVSLTVAQLFVNWHDQLLILTQNSSTLRRLASDHASLRRATPPNYLFPPTLDNSSLPDDLTQLTILVTGAQGTAYSQGLWRLHLSMPDDYPKSPPKAVFKTRIYHPNVEESTGAVCLDTLKKDWQSKLTLRDILIVFQGLLVCGLDLMANAILYRQFLACSYIPILTQP
jgi:ubiquitin-conjugating enzyme E2 S